LHTRRDFLKHAGGFTAMAATGSLLAVGPSTDALMRWATDDASTSGTIKIGVVTDLTGADSPFGLAHLNTMNLAVDAINAGGGVLGRKLELITADGESSTATATTVAQQLIRSHNPAVIIGGLSGATVAALIGVVAERSEMLYICPMQEPMGLCNENYFSTGVVPTQYATPIVPWLMDNGGPRFYLAGSNYNFPQDTNVYVKQALKAHGGTLVAEEYFPLDATDFSATVSRIMDSKVDVVFNTVVPPGFSSFFTDLYDAGFIKGGGRLACPFFDDLFTSSLPAHTYEGLAACWDYFEGLDDTFDQTFLTTYNSRYPKGPPFSGASAGAYRAIYAYALAVEKANSLDTADVRGALSEVRIPQGPGGPSRMNGNAVALDMRVGEAKAGKMVVVKDLGVIEPDYVCHPPS
jgi:ABC-type branched-subunit amino acid transport system substrate-binding protein